MGGWSSSTNDHFAQDTPDEVILHDIALKQWVFLTQDRKIRTRGPERRILLDRGVRTVSIASTANLTAQATAEVLLSAEEAIFKAVAELEGPFIIGVYKDGGIRRLDLGEDSSP